MKKFETLELAMAHILEQDVIIANNTKTIKDLEKSLSGALGEVGVLSAKLDLNEKHKGHNVVTVEKNNYILLGDRFFVGGVECNAQELMKNTTELKRMVKIKSGSLILESEMSAKTED